ncbi:MAG TPA: stage II sporulation protein R [Firmicutes bacterium]|nr:stage II sporulation protein R [Bacillota bacterium]
MKPRIVTAAIISVIAFALIVLTSISGVRGSSDHAYTYDNLIRLHVVANSNSGHDQETKLKVRDAVLKKASQLFGEVHNKFEAQTILEQNLDEFVECARATVRECGDDYEVKASMGRAWFPAKAYGDIYLPEGEYDALRIILGKGEGANWWCILFPPLCFVNQRMATEGGPGAPTIQAGTSPEVSLENLRLRLEAEARLAGTPPENSLLKWSRINLGRAISPLTLLYYSALK